MTATRKRDANLKNYKDKILVVDDEKMIRWSLGEALRGWGFEPIEAETGSGALAAFEAESPGAKCRQSCCKANPEPARTWWPKQYIISQTAPTVRSSRSIAPPCLAL